MHHFLLAYIDPGSGALLFQAIVASAVGAIAIFRSTLANITSKFFGRQRSEESSASDVNPPTR